MNGEGTPPMEGRVHASRVGGSNMSLRGKQVTPDGSPKELGLALPFGLLHCECCLGPDREEMRNKA